MANKETKTLIIITSLAILFALGFLLNVFACMIWKNWLPLIILFFWSMLALPLFTCIPPKDQWNTIDDNRQTGMDIGFFFLGTFLFSGVASPIFMAHWRMIEVGASAMAFVGGILFCSALLVFVRFSDAENGQNPYD